MFLVSMILSYLYSLVLLGICDIVLTCNLISSFQSVMVAFQYNISSNYCSRSFSWCHHVHVHGLPSTFTRNVINSLCYISLIFLD